MLSLPVPSCSSQVHHGQTGSPIIPARPYKPLQDVTRLWPVAVQVISGDGAAVRMWSHVTGRRLATLQGATGEH
jgi:hypothetical protein